MVKNFLEIDPGRGLYSMNICENFTNVCVSERDRDSVCMCCVCERERESVCVCVCECVCKREKKMKSGFCEFVFHNIMKL